MVLMSRCDIAAFWWGSAATRLFRLRTPSQLAAINVRDATWVYTPLGTCRLGFGKSPFFMMKRVVIVDDSRAMRAWLRAVLDRDPRLNVVGEAENANQARQIIKETKPDVITLDIHMPGMSGLEFLSRLMRLHPLPVVMVSAATKFGSEATITALMNVRLTVF